MIKEYPESSLNIDLSTYIDKSIFKNRQAFTLVELIVVITILAILGTIGFIAYNGYLSGTRDTNRTSQLATIYDGLEVYRTKNDLPLPENSVEVRASGSIIGYQGYMGKNNLSTIEYSKGGLDPKDGIYFTYYITADKKYYQLMAYLEDESNKQLVNNPLIPTTYAVDYSKRYPTVYGKKLGILTESGTNTPIQEVSSIVSSGYLDIVLTTNTYKANFTDLDNITGTGLTLAQSNPTASCKRIIEVGGNHGNGIYTISPLGVEFKVYCDMTTDGGGWTMLILATGSGTKFGNNSSFWKVPVYDTIVANGPQDIEFQSQSYGTVITNNILLCYKSMENCYNFEHNFNIPLMKFFTDNITYTNFSYNSAGFTNIGSTTNLNNYYSKIGITMTNYSCQWLGINYNRGNAASAIGAMADADGGCTTGVHDNSALGLGLQSCGDANGCPVGGTGHTSGLTRTTSLGQSVVTGPWFVFGK